MTLFLFHLPSDFVQGKWLLLIIHIFRIQDPFRHFASPSGPSICFRRYRLRSHRSRPDSSSLLEVHAHAGPVQSHHCQCDPSPIDSIQQYGGCEFGRNIGYAFQVRSVSFALFEDVHGFLFSSQFAFHWSTYQSRDSPSRIPMAPYRIILPRCIRGSRCQRITISATSTEQSESREEALHLVFMNNLLMLYLHSSASNSMYQPPRFSHYLVFAQG